VRSAASRPSRDHGRSRAAPCSRSLPLTRALGAFELLSIASGPTPAELPFVRSVSLHAERSNTKPKPPRPKHAVDRRPVASDDRAAVAANGLCVEQLR
jgi:hypothetical protein